MARPWCAQCGLRWSGGQPLGRASSARQREGLGQVANQPPTGSGGPITPLARAVADVRVTLAGLPCEVQYAGLAPGFVGVYQVNLRVPENAPGGLQDLVLTAGGAVSPVVKAFVQSVRRAALSIIRDVN
jgi:hypothetical protein